MIIIRARFCLSLWATLFPSIDFHWPLSVNTHASGASKDASSVSSVLVWNDARRIGPTAAYAAVSEQSLTSPSESSRSQWHSMNQRDVSAMAGKRAHSKAFEDNRRQARNCVLSLVKQWKLFENFFSQGLVTTWIACIGLWTLEQMYNGLDLSAEFACFGFFLIFFHQALCYVDICLYFLNSQTKLWETIT